MKVAIIMGSDSDWPLLEPAVKQLADLGIKNEILVASAHRTPGKVHDFAAGARERGVKVIIAAAGAAAHLAGVVASFTTLPVIGVPINSTSLGGIDALLSVAQMPAGIPVATMAINGAKNAALFAAQVLALENPALAEKLTAHREEMAREVEMKAARLLEKIGK
ncbi:MAG TPA: 5-(carboxyamino)imidazole ribonucleotide mutase [Methylomusa anaerophila]|uniref:N5-carboxyaminoimidazole ribonucleotide mutase n=1 Tax=Methylomusa anaerophila TaxID=1930071 RepID=A0A348AMN6_9FIRM|nr:5-(carboxyamino)imidazole ribonucleotide mutase [Methylomusa anaerophila]BBB92334.1 N5-carboxyaminoimidazole ribonucleotide mutase [Methylomusa anaerophila]HML90026.1 5-(carboxyamino)imidazole ribonucleotide mutase [Methylomusa anaerophila]